MNASDLSQSRRIDQAVLPDRPGCYVVTANSEAMAQLGLGASPGQVALYVGKAEDSIRKRVSNTHLVKSRTGSSTLRRSVGALLREVLALRPQPRSKNTRDSKRFANYRFDSEGEARLSDWIAENIRVVGVESSSPVATEAHLIGELHPPLNLTGWVNPDAQEIKAARAACARRARESSTID